MLFRRGGYIYKYAVMIEKIFNETLAELLWGHDEDGETWSEIFFFSRITDKKVPASRINKSLGRSERDNWQGLVVLSLKESEELDAFFRKQLEAL